MIGSGEVKTRDECQVVDLLSDRKCDPFMKYPLKASLIAGGLLNKAPVVCGGGIGGSASPQCFMYDRNDRGWKLHANLKTGRYYHAALVVGDKLWVTGGEESGGGRSSLKSTEYVFANKSVLKGPDLPRATSRHCAVDLLGALYMIPFDRDECFAEIRFYKEYT